MSSFFFCLVGAVIVIALAVLLLLLVLLIGLGSVVRRVERLEEAKKGLTSLEEENRRRAL